MGQELSGKVAIVTGGASGIGRAAVELFAEEGAKVVIADVDPARGEALATEVGAAAAFKRTDVANADEIQGAVDFAVERFGALDIMFNNAGISGSMRRFLDDGFEDFQRMMEVNLLGVVLTDRALAQQMLSQGTGGTIVNIASTAGSIPLAGSVP